MPIYITAMIALITAVLGVAALKVSSGMEKRRKMYDEAIKNRDTSIFGVLSV